MGNMEDERFMSDYQYAFFMALASIQNSCVCESLCKAEKYADLEEAITDISYEVIYRIMELIDGYSETEMHLSLIDMKTGLPMNDGIELHDACTDFLKCANK